MSSSSNLAGSPGQYWNASSGYTSRQSSLDSDMASFDLNSVSYRNSPNPNYQGNSYGWSQPYADSPPQMAAYGHMSSTNLAYSNQPSAPYPSQATAKRPQPAAAAATAAASRPSAKASAANDMSSEKRLAIEAAIREAVKRHDKDEALRLFRERGESFKDIERYWPMLFGEQSTAGALRMRASRGKRARREWEDSDTEFCRRAMDELSKNQFEFVSQEMRRLGCDKRWSAEECRRHWVEACNDTRRRDSGHGHYDE